MLVGTDWYRCQVVWYSAVPMSRARRTTTATSAGQHLRSDDEVAARERILDAAFAAFTEGGYAAASTLDIATRARVSKRELYALVGNKHEMLLACIQGRALRLQMPAELPAPHDRETLTRLLASFATQLVREVTDPAVVAVFRLAIAEAVHAPEVARALDSIGREAARASLRRILTQAKANGLLEGRPAELVEQYIGLLWGDLMMRLLLGIARQPTPHEIAGRASDAAAAFLQLHPAPRA
jgi:AcrR family transcriptional regulator